MLYVSTPYVVIQTSIQALMMFTMMHYLSVKDYRWFNTIADSLFAVLVSVIALVISDAVWILVLIFLLLADKLSKKSKANKYLTSVTFMMSCVTQIVIVLCATYIFKLILLVLTHSFSLQAMISYRHSLVITTSVTEIAVTIMIIHWINKHQQNINTVKNQINDFEIKRQIFIMVFSVFIALEIILIISELQLVASLILGVLAFTFCLITFLITYQMIILIKTYHVKQEALNIRKQNTQLNGYMTNIEQQYTEFRKFKHDYKNLLLSLKTMIDTNDSKQLKSYYNELSHQDIVQQTNDAHLLVATDKIENEPIRGLLIQKFFSAQKYGIKFLIEIPDTTINIDRHVVPIVRILGILLDNAIEYVNTHPQYDRFIKCAFIDHPHSVEIIVENPTNELINLDKIFELGYTTKGEMHGYGLSNVSELVKKIPTLFISTELKDTTIQISFVHQKEA